MLERLAVHYVTGAVHRAYSAPTTKRIFLCSDWSRSLSPFPCSRRADNSEPISPAARRRQRDIPLNSSPVRLKMGYPPATGVVLSPCRVCNKAGPSFSECAEPEGFGEKKEKTSGVCESRGKRSIHLRQEALQALGFRLRGPQRCSCCCRCSC